MDSLSYDLLTGSSADPLTVLARCYGYQAFRGKQAEIIDHLMQGKHAFVLMPTGGGKSLCYQIPSICRPGIGIIISPLIALMENQVMALQELGIRADAINSSMSYDQVGRIIKAMRTNTIDLVYVSPERLLMDDFLLLLDDCQIALFAIDEAHCVSQWGHDFRPEYQQLEVLAQRYSDIPRIALTATADEATRVDILQRLGLVHADCFVAGFDRPNIHYSIVDYPNPRAQLLKFIQNHHAQDSGIVYCLSRSMVDDIAQWLSQRDLVALPYHAGMSNQDRSEHQDRFIKEESIIIVATIAFGMGIDKPNVRFVAHMSLPKSIEAYYQETGRAGRDGLPANAWMTFTSGDVAIQRHFVDSQQSSDNQKRIEHQKLTALLGFCETTRCRRQVLLEYFGDQCQPCGNCDNCETPADTFDGQVAAQKALSCAYRTGERFGVAYLVQVLLGKSNDRITRFSHHRLSTFGVGTEYTQAQWQYIFRQLIAHNLLGVDLKGHGGLYITEQGKAFLKQKDTLLLRVMKKVQKTASRSKTRKANKSSLLKSDALDNQADSDLFEALRLKRLELAKKANLPPYVIFHDSALIGMAKHRPRTPEQLLQINGVGEKKVQRYGEVFLQMIAVSD